MSRALAAVLAAIGLGAAAAPASAADFTWTGGADTAEWSDAGNWVTGTPSGSVGTLAFPALTTADCAAVPPMTTCDASTNDVSGITANAITIDDGFDYRITGTMISLGAGGITAAPSAATANSAGNPRINVPITLTDAQIWSITGGANNQQLNVDSAVTGGAGATLDVVFSDQTFLGVYADDEVGPVTFTGAGTLALGSPATTNFPAKLGRLNAGNGRSVAFSDGAGLFSPLGALGPTTVAGGQVQIGYPSKAGTLAVSGGLALDASSTLLTYLNTSGAAGVGYSQITATGTVNLGGATLRLDGTADGTAPCASLTPGDVATLITTSGSLTGTFAGIPDGTTIPVTCAGVGTGTAPTVRINYTSQKVTATVTGGGSNPPGDPPPSDPPPTSTPSGTPPPPPPPNSPPTTAKRPTATQVICTYTFATMTNRCTASVGDGGPPPNDTPTGTVTFTGTGPGFRPGLTCQLTASASAPTVPSCSISYSTMSGTVLPSITATYAGDARHGSSQGATQYLGGGPAVGYDTTVPAGAAGRYPNEVDLSTIAPVDGTTIEACVVTGGAPANGGARTRNAEALVAAAGRIIVAKAPETNAVVDAAQKSLAALDRLAEDPRGASGTPTALQGVYTPAAVATANTAIGGAASSSAQIVQRIRLIADQAARAAAAPAADTVAKSLSEAVGNVARQARKACSAAASSPRAVFGAGIASAARTTRGKSSTRLAYTIARRVKAGPRRLRLKLGKAALAKLTAGRKSVTVTVRTTMLVPSAQFPAGHPVFSVRKVTLRRAASRGGRGKRR